MLIFAAGGITKLKVLNSSAVRPATKVGFEPKVGVAEEGEAGEVN